MGLVIFHAMYSRFPEVDKNSDFPPIFGSKLTEMIILLLDHTAISFITTRVFQNPPFVYGDGITTKFSGYVFDIWNPLQQVLNFTSHIITSVDGKWGAKESDGNWNGMIGMVLRGEADVIVADLTLSMDRASYVDFSHSLHGNT